MTQASRELPLSTSYIPDGNPGPYGGGTYTTHPTEPTIRDYENVFGPSARDIKDDLQKYKRHGRWHLPDILQGPNPWLTDRIDGLITGMSKLYPRVLGLQADPSGVHAIPSSPVPRGVLGILKKNAG